MKNGCFLALCVKIRNSWFWRSADHWSIIIEDFFPVKVPLPDDQQPEEEKKDEQPTSDQGDGKKEEQTTDKPKEDGEKEGKEEKDGKTDEKKEGSEKKDSKKKDKKKEKEEKKVGYELCLLLYSKLLIEPRHEKTFLRGLRPG